MEELRFWAERDGRLRGHFRKPHGTIRVLESNKEKSYRSCRRGVRVQIQMPDTDGRTRRPGTFCRRQVSDFVEGEPAVPMERRFPLKPVRDVAHSGIPVRSS